MAHTEPSHLDLHCLPFWSWFKTIIPICNNGTYPNSKMEESTSETRVKGLTCDLKPFDKAAPNSFNLGPVASGYTLPLHCFSLSM